MKYPAKEMIFKNKENLKKKIPKIWCKSTPILSITLSIQTQGPSRVYAQKEGPRRVTLPKKVKRASGCDGKDP